MPTTDSGQVIAITEETLARAPKRIAKRLKLGLRPGMEKEFREWVDDMGYVSHIESPMVRQMLFEAFIGGWGAKVRSLKKKVSAKKAAAHE